MVYVKHFDILGIDTVQIPCIELQGVPNTATEGAVGLLGMNMASADHEIYVCTAVSGNIYTWTPLKGEGGNTVTAAKVNEAGELILTLSNGTMINAGVVAGSGCYVNGVATDVNFNGDPQTQIDGCVKKTGDTVSGTLNVEGRVLIPNSPSDPETAQVIDSYSMRQTADATERGLSIVDGQYTSVSEIEGNTVIGDEGFEHAYFSGIKSMGRNLLDSFATPIWNDATWDKSGTLVAGDVAGTLTGNTSYNSGGGNGIYIGYLISGTKVTISCIAKFNDALSAAIKLLNLTLSCRNINGTNITQARTVNGESKISWTVTIPVDGDYYFRPGYQTFFDKNYVFTLTETMINVGDEVPFEPYVEDKLSLSEQLELAKWDKYYPESGLVERRNHRIEFTGDEKWSAAGNGGISSSGGILSWLAFNYIFTESGETTPWRKRISTYFDSITSTDYYNGAVEGIGGYKGYITVKVLRKTLEKTEGYVSNGTNADNVEAFQNYIKNRIAAGEPFIVESRTEVVMSTETVLANASSYKAWSNGTEIVMGNTNAGYGAELTISQTYSIHENPKEVASKEYVNNGLAKKLDTAGGKITGSLTVENGVNATLSGIVIKDGETTYGLAYEDDAYKLGQGAVGDTGDFAFNENEGLPIALRDDSTSFTDGHIVKWSSSGNKFVDGGSYIKQVPIDNRGSGTSILLDTPALVMVAWESGGQYKTGTLFVPDLDKTTVSEGGMIQYDPIANKVTVTSGTMVSAFIIPLGE